MEEGDNTRKYNINLYRMVHIDNIPHILAHGLTHKDSPNSNPNYRPIGDKALIDARQDSHLSGDNNIGDYIPFYFGVRTPMLYTIQKGFNDVTMLNPEEIIYCISNVQLILDEGLDFSFTDGHAAAAITSTYEAKDIENIDNIVDFEAVHAIFWTEYPDMKRRKSAEFLVKEDIPNSCILGYAVYNETAKNKLIELGVSEENIGIRPHFYF